MPLHTSFSVNDAQVLVWEVSEPLSFFLKHTELGEEELKRYEEITHEARKREWLSSRFALKQLLPNCLTSKDEFDKPILLNFDGAISLSHSKDFAAVMYHPDKEVGIDIEPIHPKIKRISKRFLAEEEAKLIDEDSIADLISLWTMKEAVYKWHARKELTFKKDILLQLYKKNSKKKVALVKLQKNDNIMYLEVFIIRLNDSILAYTFK